uniref:thermonuclease family protein n=1 Tax=Aquisphaera insulae TaxID=2712864 RepID=UPI00202E445D
MRLPAVLVALMLPMASPAAEDFQARVVGVADGDTFTVLTADRWQVRMRLHGVDSPESGQDFGTRAKQEASALAGEKL